MVTSLRLLLAEICFYKRSLLLKSSTNGLTHPYQTELHSLLNNSIHEIGYLVSRLEELQFIVNNSARLLKWDDCFRDCKKQITFSPALAQALNALEDIAILNRKRLKAYRGYPYLPKLCSRAEIQDLVILGFSLQAHLSELKNTDDPIDVKMILGNSFSPIRI